MPQGHSIPPGPSILQRLERELTHRWLAYDVAPHAGLKGEIRGLAYAIALMRMAPRTPTEKDVKETAEEYQL